MTVVTSTAIAIGAKRGIDLNAADVTIKNSHISDIKGIGLTRRDRRVQRPGPYVIDNNYVEAAGENILFGGSDPHYPISFRPTSR